MHPSQDPRSPDTPQTGAALQRVLTMARRLHKAATSESLALSLPVLRRVLATQTLRDLALPALHRDRASVQRKHILRMLAIEAGHDSWEAYRVALSTPAPQDLEHFDLMRSAAGYPNLWFSTPEQAAAHAATHGGRAVRVGPQAVILNDPR
jgi:hypothetical protein